MKKKWLALFLAVSMSCSVLASCGEAEDDDDDDDDDKHSLAALFGKDDDDDEEDSSSEEDRRDEESDLASRDEFYEPDSSEAEQAYPIEKQTINIYTFTEETEYMMGLFLEDNPEFAERYDFNYSIKSSSYDYIQMVSADIASGYVDLFLADADYARLFAEFDETASLKELGISFDPSEYYQYTLDFTKVDGEYKGLSHQAAPGAVLYRRDYAQQVLGSDDPDTVQAAMSDWTKFKATADKMNENGIYMISGIDELRRCFMSSRNGPWVTDNMQINIDEATLKEYLEVTKYLNDNHEINLASNTQWGYDWYKGMQSGVFCYFGSTWYLHYVIKPASVAVNYENGVPFVEDYEMYVGNGSYGKWGIIPGPAPYFWGGTWWFGTKSAVENGKAEAVRAIIEYFCVNDDTMKMYMDRTGDFPSKITVAEQLSTTNDFLAGQDHYEIFREAAEKIDGTNLSVYDDTFNGAVMTATEDYVLNGYSLQEAIDYIADYSRASLDL